MCFFFTKKTQKTQQQQQQQKLSNIKTSARAENWMRDLLHPKRMRYLCVTESIESNDCSQAILLFRRNVSKRK